MLVRERGTDRDRQRAADAAAVDGAHRPVELVDVPQAPAIRADRSPVFAFDHVPHLRRDALQRDRARVPSVSGLDARALERLRRCGRQRLAALVERAPARRRDELLARFDERGQRRLRIGRYT